MLLDESDGMVVRLELNGRFVSMVPDDEGGHERAVQRPQGLRVSNLRIHLIHIKNPSKWKGRLAKKKKRIVK